MLVDQVIGLITGGLEKIPDGNVRAEVEGEIRVAITENLRTLTPQAIAALLVLGALIRQLERVEDGKPLIWVTLGVKLSLLVPLLGMDPDDLKDVRKQVQEWQPS